MSGTFSSFGSALSALRYNRVAMDTASNNVANANTPGYTRRMAVAQATGAPAVPALWSTWNGTSGGVEVGGIERMVDPLLSARSRTEHASLAFLDTRSASLVRLETTLNEPGENGVAAALSAFKAGWHDVANNPGDEAARSQLLGRAQTLVESINSQAAAVSTEWSDQRARLTSVVAETTQVADDLAKLNEALKAANNAGTDANTLLDQRDQLTLRLAQLTGAKTVINEDTTATVYFGGTLANGQALVNGSTSTPLELAGADDMSGAESAPLNLTLSGVPMTQPNLVRGELGGTLKVLQEDLPGYLGKLDGFANELASSVNGVHTGAYDLDGSLGLDFFGLTEGATALKASTIAVSIKDPWHVAASAEGRLTGEPIPDPREKFSLDGSKALQLGGEDMGGGTYRSLITDFGVQVASAKRLTTNQAVLTNQVDATWESLSGVNIDEEMVNLLAAQRAYEGASRVITTLDSVLDTLINRTGITR
jgi:flagellar hook-associated protein 1 FlgK